MDKQIEAGLNFLFTHDDYLLSNAASERSITHRLGLYYQSIFKGWDVDCELNINLGGPKIITIEPQDFIDRMARLLGDDYQAGTLKNNIEPLLTEHMNARDLQSVRDQLDDKERLYYDSEFDMVYFALTLNNGKTEWKKVYPDIVVHRRNTADNLVVIEAKKSTNKDARSRIYDLLKLTVLTNDPSLAYTKGYFLDVPVDSDFGRLTKIKFKNNLLENKITHVWYE